MAPRLYLDIVAVLGEGRLCVTHLIGISGKKGSGKSTLASLLAGHLGDAEIRPLAEPLKEICHDVLGIPRELLWGSDDDKQGLTTIRQRDMPHWRQGHHWHYDAERALCRSGGTDFLTVRQVMQQLATEIFRAIRPNCWIDAMVRRHASSESSYMIVDDIRFPDEAEAIHTAGGRLVHLTRRGEPDSPDPHSSESALDKYDEFDLIVDNRDLTPDETLAHLVLATQEWFAGPNATTRPADGPTV